MADVKSEHDKTRFYLMTDDGKPWVCRLKFLAASPKGKKWRFETLDAVDREVISTCPETPPPDTIDGAVVEYQKLQLMRLRRNGCTMNQTLSLILAAEQLRNCEVKSDSTDTCGVFEYCDDWA